ncbi:Anaerobic_ribonucleoside-triphosphate reductase [Hexamita inflata]|uniref:Anaerobic ribonucleoside-triphosphate reductase n=1 Tax=Hexamita inflata TaxID=28002 RepID=A0AA86N5Q0_9EUKA|nr:Anaerobic ribonucleoside-triphosphate reductase [Hexamita inflata]
MSRDIIFNGRANADVVSINPVRCALIVSQDPTFVKGDTEKFYQLVDNSIQLAIQVHNITREHLKLQKASSNPLFFCEGGCYKKLLCDDTLESVLEGFSWSIGYIGLNECSLLLYSKELHESNQFAIEFLSHLKEQLEAYQKQFNMMFSIYGTPAESMTYSLNQKDRKQFGIVKGVTDKKYYINSFHCNIRQELDPVDKMTIEAPLFHLSKGGRITYTELPNVRNMKAIGQLCREAMKLGLYWGINIQLDECKDCGHSSEFFEHCCSECKSTNIVEITRVCGYISFRLVKGRSRMNDGKLQEIEERVDHVKATQSLKPLKNNDIVNGPGLRVSVWLNGCPHKCKGCHNQQLWDYKPSIPYNVDEIVKLMCTGIQKDLSILGGEPLAPENVNITLKICQAVKQILPDRNIWLWTGYDYEQVKDFEVMKLIDVLVDGKFIQEKKDVSLQYRGSTNQRILNPLTGEVLAKYM